MGRSLNVLILKFILFFALLTLLCSFFQLKGAPLIFFAGFGAIIIILFFEFRKPRQISSVKRTQTPKKEDSELIPDEEESAEEESGEEGEDTGEAADDGADEGEGDSDAGDAGGEQ